MRDTYADAVTWRCRLKVKLEAGGRYSVREWLEVQESGFRESTIRVYDDTTLDWVAPHCRLADDDGPAEGTEG